MPIRNARPFQKYRLYLNEVANVEHDAGSYADAHNTSVSTFETQNVDSGLSISGETTSGNDWSALLTATNTGNWFYELVITYADSTKQILPFEIEVYEVTQ